MVPINISNNNIVNITKESLKTEKRNNVFCVLYNQEVVFQSPRKEDINYDNILSVIVDIEKEYPKLDLKTKKVLIILGQNAKERSSRVCYLQDRLILADKDCLDVLKGLGPDAEKRFQVTAALNNVDFVQYNFNRLWKKWVIFFVIGVVLYLLKMPLIVGIILFVLFLLTEPIPFAKILTIIGKFKQNS